MNQTPLEFMNYKVSHGAKYVGVVAAVTMLVLLDYRTRPSLMSFSFVSVLLGSITLLVLKLVGLRTFVVNYIPAAISAVCACSIVAEVDIRTAHMPSFFRFCVTTLVLLVLPFAAFFSSHYILSRLLLPTKPK